MGEPASDIYLPFRLADLSAASSVSLACPTRGRIRRTIARHQATVTGTSVLTTSTARGDLADTISKTGTAANGDVRHRPNDPNAEVFDGDTITITSDGGSTNVSQVDGFVVIGR